MEGGKLKRVGFEDLSIVKLKETIDLRFSTHLSAAWQRSLRHRFVASSFVFRCLGTVTTSKEEKFEEAPERVVSDPSDMLLVLPGG